jgi:hypothetical protein
MRWEFQRAKKEITQYVVQLEANVGGRWIAVVRYDVAHGFPHKDILQMDGTRSKDYIDTTYDPSVGYRDGLDAAMSDVRSNWESYYQRFTEGGSSE